MATENDKKNENEQVEEQNESVEQEETIEETQNEENEESDDDEALGEVGKKALERERKERRAIEKEKRRLERELEKHNESDEEAALRAARDEGAQEWRERYVRSEARTALVTAGVQKQPKKLLNLIDLDKVEIDDDGDVTGLDAQIDDLKEEFPELFAKPAPGNGDTGPKSEAKGPKSLGQRLAANNKS